MTSATSATSAAPDHPLVEAAHRVATDVLAPIAEQVDQDTVPESSIAAIRTSGLLGLNAPVEYGGSAVSAAVFRETTEILAGACCSTWFVQTQHHTPVKTLTASVGSDGSAKERLLRPLATGELMSGIAFSHLRAHPRIMVGVTPERGGWRFDGRVPWYTGWGLNDVMLLAGVTEDGQALFAFTEAREQAGLRPSAPMRLASLTAGRTVSLELDGLWLPEEAVVSRVPYESWAAADRPKNLNATPAVFGITRSAIALVAAAGDPDAAETAAALGERLDATRREAYELTDHPEPGEHVAERLALKAQAFDLLRAATAAAVVSGGGRAMDLRNPAQRLAREGMFLMVQGQTKDVRRAHLASL